MRKRVAVVRKLFALRKKARELQKPKIWLGVWEENDYAVQFYQSQGFRQTGTHEFRTGDVIDHDLVMEKVLED